MKFNNKGVPMRAFNLLTLMLLTFSVNVNSLMAAEADKIPAEVKISAYYKTEGENYLRTDHYNRAASCGSYHMQTQISRGELQLKKNLIGSNLSHLEELTRACSLMSAYEDGKRVCESDGFSWLRSKNGDNEKTIYLSSRIGDTNCKEENGSISCTTEFTVYCAVVEKK